MPTHDVDSRPSPPPRNPRPWASLTVLIGLLVPASASCASEDLPRQARKWVESTLAGLSLPEKAGQMVMVGVNGRYYHPRSPDYVRLSDEVGHLKVGGLVVFDSDVEAIPRLLNRLQQEADLPLLVAADTERGMAFRVRQGTVPLPYAMAIGATRSEEAARFAGRVTAREGRALGIHWAFAPVVDVNVNPANPVIHIRSFGEEAELVARLAGAFVEGVREGGMLATVKHFPGHGDTTVDSHLALPTVDADLERLEAVELLPFRRAADAGVDAVMVGHLAVPALDPSETPATLSPLMVDGLLRRRMGFQGLVVTDAMEMEGIAGTWAGAAAVRAVQAGADVILMPPDVRVAVRSLVRAVDEGELGEARLDESVRRLLEIKARLGLHRERRVDADAVERHVADPADVERALEIARASVTVVKNEGKVLPIRHPPLVTPEGARPQEPVRLLHLSLASDLRNVLDAELPEDDLAARGVEVTLRRLGPEVSTETAADLLASTPGFSHVVVSAVARPAGLPPSQVRLIQRLLATGPPVILLSFGSPYLLEQLPAVPVYVCTYGHALSSRRAAVGALFGEFPVRGKVPVTLSELYPYGHGLEIPRVEMTLPRVSPEEAGFRRGGLEEVDRIVESFVEQKAFPGAVLAVGYRGGLVHLKPYGRLSYDDEAPPVTADTIYDLASLTKVVATATMAMIQVDEGRLDLDGRVAGYLPRFEGPGKEEVTVRHLLTHSSGVDWWAPLYEELEGAAAFLERIQAMDLVYEPGTRTQYSDLGLILLGEVLERTSGRALDEFARARVFEPLGMTDTLFRPGPELRPRIAPTEQDAWRGRMAHGEVHDENAFALGGVAPHAGLFGTAGDLARFAQMILNGGVFEHRRIVSRWTLRTFTRRADVPDSTRALGWDTRSAEGSSAGTLFSPGSFGHTGFTGTSIWIDPRRQLFVILLTNRVHPTRDNTLIRQARPAVADAVVRALKEP